jgi:hypothetical protein
MSASRVRIAGFPRGLPCPLGLMLPPGNRSGLFRMWAWITLLSASDRLLPPIRFRTPRGILPLYGLGFSGKRCCELLNFYTVQVMRPDREALLSTAGVARETRGRATKSTICPKSRHAAARHPEIMKNCTDALNRQPVSVAYFQSRVVMPLRGTHNHENGLLSVYDKRWLLEADEGR